MGTPRAASEPAGQWRARESKQCEFVERATMRNATRSDKRSVLIMHYPNICREADCKWVTIWATARSIKSLPPLAIVSQMAL